MAEPDAVATKAEVLKAEAGFWAAFNRCDAQGMVHFFTNDAEFYHDKTGLTASRDQIVSSMISGPCSGPAAERFQRVPVAGSQRFDMLAGGFALLTGQHRFVAASQAVQQSGIGSYVEIWQRSSDGWRMRRVISYDHQPEPAR